MKCTNMLQNAGYVMPGWYDIVSRRENVRNPVPYSPFVLVTY